MHSSASACYTTLCVAASALPTAPSVIFSRRKKSFPIKNVAKLRVIKALSPSRSRERGERGQKSARAPHAEITAKIGFNLEKFFAARAQAD